MFCGKQLHNNHRFENFKNNPDNETKTWILHTFYISNLFSQDYNDNLRFINRIGLLDIFFSRIIIFKIEDKRVCVCIAHSKIDNQSKQYYMYCLGNQKSLFSPCGRVNVYWHTNGLRHQTTELSISDHFYASEHINWLHLWLSRHFLRGTSLF